jgi:D-erythronate 2-dehydrogenase
MLGQKLARSLLESGRLAGKPITQLVLADQTTPAAPPSDVVDVVSVDADISRVADCARIIEYRPDVIFHLAAVVSGQAEADFELGYRINVDGTKQLCEAIRNVGGGYCPRVVFTSSVAVYGGPYPDLIEDDFHLTPLTSYGAHKVIGEILLSDYSRKGFLDALSIRLPTVCVRPGTPNAAVSGVFSNILREPLTGKAATLTVSRDLSMVFCSPRSAVGFLIHAAELDTDLLGHQRSLMMPALRASISDEIEALGRQAGEEAVSLITTKIDPVAEATLRSWDFPEFASTRARGLGFIGDSSVDDLIRIFREDDAP